MRIGQLNCGALMGRRERMWGGVGKMSLIGALSRGCVANVVVVD